MKKIKSYKKDIPWGKTFPLNPIPVGGSGDPPFRGEEVYLPPPSISGDIKLIELKIGLKVSHDYNIYILP